LLIPIWTKNNGASLAKGQPPLPAYRLNPAQEEPSMSRYWSPIVHKLEPYVPGEQPRALDLVKLNTNENPYGPSPMVLAALKGAAESSLRLYPDPDSSELKEALSQALHVPQAHVFVGNGSDEILAHAFHGLLNHEQALLHPDITYSFYPVYCRLYGIESQLIPLTDSLQINCQDYDRGNGGIIFPNPNAPTGSSVSLEDIEALLKRNTDSVVIIDEAYIDFGGQSAIPLVRQFPNLLVIQTFSKSRSLAGLRVGFAIGQAELIEALEKIKNSFNSYPLGSLSVKGAVAALKDRDYFESSRQKIIGAREQLAKELTAMGFQVAPSVANFIFVRHPNYDGAQLAQELRKRSIIVRHFKAPRIEQFLRITIGTREQCDILCQALRVILAL
jgi:histidinol-phosphate aminotransferase